SGRGADTILAQADDYYAQGSYTKSEDSYDQFVKRFPKHPGVGKARVRLSLARMRQTIGGDWPHALDVAKREIPLMSGEETFGTDARPELASMLPDIAEGLANKAHSDQDGKTADLAEEALALVEKYVASSSRPLDRLQDIQALIGLTRREIARTEKLSATVAEMSKSAAEGRTQEGYQLRRDLLKEYPVLLDAAPLVEAVRMVSTAEQAAVRKVDHRIDALTGEPVSKALATVGLAQRTVQSLVPGVAEQRVFAVAGGAVYGLAATDGKVLWRQNIGFEQSVRGAEFPPTPISDSAGADPLLVSRSRQEVLRVDASTGKVRWRLPVGEAFDAHPVVHEGRVYVATLSGRLLTLDLESGNSQGYIEFPQPLRVGPVADGGRDTLYQAGEHSSLFVLSATDGGCRRVIYLGHEAGTIIVPPVRIDRYLLVCENDGVRDSMIKVLDLEAGKADETTTIQPIQQVRLKGHFFTAPIVQSPHVLVVTDSGAISVFQLTGGESKGPLSLSAEGTTSGEDRTELVRYASMAGGQLWIADSQLTQYAVRASASRLNPGWIVNEGSISMQPPIVAGDAVIQVRQRRGMPGVVAAAVSASDGSPLWETTLASPMPGLPVVDPATQTLIAVTAVGGVFQVKAPAEGETVFRDDPARTIPSAELTAPLEQVVRLPGGAVAMIPGGRPVDIPVFAAGRTAEEARIRHLGLTSPLSGDAVVFADGLLTPTEGGQVFVLDAGTGAEIAKPFQPQLEAGRTYRWSRPAVIGKDQFVIADDAGGIYRVQVKADPIRHLAAAATAQLDDPVTSPIAVLGNLVYAVDRADSLVRLDLSDLVNKTQTPLGAKCVLGPWTVGNRVVLVTDDERMHVIDSSGKSRSDKLPYGQPTGEPLADGSHWLLASATGVVWRVDPATGDELGKKETELALAAGPALSGSRLLAAGHDGTLYWLEKP
ncbi:MAG: outer membrane protein assembly factor BamB family protein, partial [Thermoguttaceae bacterium]